MGVIKAVILLVLGLLLLGGAGFGGWMIYNKYFVEHEESAPKKEEPPPKPPTGFVRMAPFVVPAIGTQKVEQFVTVVVTLEVVLDKVPYVQARQPLVYDRCLSALYAAVDDRSVMTGNLVNIIAVKEKLSAAAAKVVGEGVVQNVLVQVVTQRNL
ncbi:hypothetical protein JJL56_12515 [Azospirillum sp. YIM DDC1]|uniref:Flagellar protein FliL n=1 Tax=Azospirillum aestuarii TaxID=2802052 RepID=A0ABS1HXZ5_9PROT|nr:hypothetical protein [Azospirillum aestuarii]MBK3776270.1 hypothetical protein [Azospirillum brasilense]MBK4719695.1 hypothetical protein [Azospirillum aestuarii]